MVIHTRPALWRLHDIMLTLIVSDNDNKTVPGGLMGFGRLRNQRLKMEVSSGVGESGGSGDPYRWGSVSVGGDRLGTCIWECYSGYHMWLHGRLG